MRFIRYWLPAIVWMMAIFALSGRSSVQVAQEPIFNFIFFKTLHILEYALLYILFFRALKQTVNSFSGFSIFVAAFLLTIIYAATDEIHQTFVSTREGRARDVIIDAIGAAAAWISLTHLLPRAPRKLRSLGKSWGLD
ncbi:VanZ family protein [Candidatus Gottesmanbacteria bacterium]|nr:VanZ family protein [Candidatus Gottesmanbacteria bacterium]